MTSPAAQPSANGRSVFKAEVQTDKEWLTATNAPSRSNSVIIQGKTAIHKMYELTSAGKPTVPICWRILYGLSPLYGFEAFSFLTQCKARANFEANTAIFKDKLLPAVDKTVEEAIAEAKKDLDSEKAATKAEKEATTKDDKATTTKGEEPDSNFDPYFIRASICQWWITLAIAKACGEENDCQAYKERLDTYIQIAREEHITFQGKDNKANTTAAKNMLEVFAKHVPEILKEIPLCNPEAWEMLLKL